MKEFMMAYPGWTFLIVAAVLAAVFNIADSVAIAASPMTAAFAISLLRKMAVDRHTDANHDTSNFNLCEYGECEDSREALRVLEERLAAR